MRKLFLFTLLIFPVLITAQETEQKHKIDFSGYVGYEMFFDTYNSATTRDGEVYLYPWAENLDINDKDINKNFQAQMLSIQSRVRMTSSGLSALGANLKGVVEGDFLGTAQDYTRLFRLRHAFVQLNWSKSNLILGQTWHPMFVTGCFPGVFSFGAAAPFHPLNRAPQLRYTFSPTKNFDIMGAMLFHGDFKSKGPANAQQNSGVPDMQFQFVFKNNFLFTGITTGYKILTPRQETVAGVKTNENVGSYNLQVFAKLTTKLVIVKVEGVYGENLTNFVMIGGYGASENPALVDDYSYANIKTMSVWSDVATNFKKLNGGVFVGYSSNLGANGDYYSLGGYTRGEDIRYIFRISPRAQYTSGKLTFIIEHIMTGAAYGTLDVANADYSFIDKDSPKINHRVLFGVKYSF